MTLRDILTDDVLARDKYRRVEVSPRELERYMNEDIHRYPRVYAGTHHVTVPAEKRRFISFVEWPVTAGELARAYLRRCYESSDWGGLPFRGPRLPPLLGQTGAPLHRPHQASEHELCGSSPRILEHRPSLPR